MERQRTFRQQTVSDAVISCALRRINTAPSHSGASCVDRGLGLSHVNFCTVNARQEKRCVCTSMVSARSACPAHNTQKVKKRRRNQHAIEHMTNAVCLHSVQLTSCWHAIDRNRTPNKNMSRETTVDQIAQIFRDTSVTSNNTTNSHRTTTRHLRAPILACHHACVSPLGNLPCVTRDNIQHAPRIKNGTVANASEKSKWCHAHQMALQT